MFRTRGLSSRIYAAFLITAAVPVMIAGLVGIYYSLDALKNETLQHLDHEVSGRAAGLGRFFDQVTSELLLLTNLPVVLDLADALARSPSADRPVRERVERAYAAFARAYPYLYQVRFLSAGGKEIVRVDRRDERAYVVPEEALQDKSDRYYVHEALEHEPGQVYVSPLDLNVEHGRIEEPERPVVRFATPMPDRTGVTRGMVILNLHADFMLEQIQEMAGLRGGMAYLFDRSGFFVSRSSNPAAERPALRMESVERLTPMFPRPLLAAILRGERGTEVSGEWIIAHAPIQIGRTLAERSDSSMEWTIASAFPRHKLFEAVFNLYLLYGVLALCLAATAVGGYALSKHLLRPLSLLSRETEEIARGNFTHRVEIRGNDEIADLGARFNAMAGRLEQSYRSLEGQKGRLAEEVHARTAQLERERRNLATVIESTADGILALDADGTIELANGTAVRFFGAERGSLVGRHVRELWPGWDDSRTVRGAGEENAGRYDLAVGGRTLSLSVAAVAPQEALQGWILALRDVSEERRLRDAQRELDRQMFQMEKMNTLGELAMGVAHEIGNPLAGMKTIAQVLQDEEGMSDRARDYLRRIESEINRLSAFLQTFHGFAAPQATHPAPCRLEAVLDDVLLWTHKEARSRGVSIEYAPCCQRVPELFADPGQLKQVLLNLVINAVQAMPDGGRIEIGMCAMPQDLAGGVPRMRFCVSDTGPGIAPEVLPRIFDPFYTTRPDGSGLGLAVVKKIALQHGADIRVESRHGEGTRFEIAWPIVLPTEPADQAQQDTDAPTACPEEAAHA